MQDAQKVNTNYGQDIPLHLLPVGATDDDVRIYTADKNGDMRPHHIVKGQIKHRKLKQNLKPTGYYEYTLYVRGRSRTDLAHWLVYSAHSPDCKDIARVSVLGIRLIYDSVEIGNWKSVRDTFNQNGMEYHPPRT